MTFMTKTHSGAGIRCNTKYIQHYTIGVDHGLSSRYRVLQLLPSCNL